MPKDTNSEPLTSKLELVAGSAAIAFSLAGLFIPVLLPVATIIDLAAFSLNAHNQNMLCKRLARIEAITNQFEVQTEQYDQADEEQREILSLNTTKYLEYALREKMELKIHMLAKIYVEGINNGSAFANDDWIDIKMEIIYSLRMEDIALLGYIVSLVQHRLAKGLSNEFEQETISVWVTNQGNVLNRYALRHLVNLGLLEERMEAAVGEVGDGAWVIDDRIKFFYSLTDRFEAIQEAISPKTRSD